MREDFPSPFFTPERRVVETENTLNHEIGHPWDTLLTLQGRDHHAKYWAFRKFPGTWELAQAAADLQGLGGWQFQPRESWAECFGAAMSGRWTKPEKTMNWGKTVDALAARAFFQGLAGVQPVTHAIEWLGPVPTTNFSQGRSGNPISLIVDHWMAATFDSALAHFMVPGIQVSAHYLVSQTGRIVQVVRDEDTAYHAGTWPANQMSIGIEHEASPTVLPSSALYAASGWLHHKLSLDYGLHLVVGETVEPHRNIVPTACPGTLDLDRIVAEAGGGEVTDQEFIDFYNRLIKPGADATIQAVKDRLAIDAHHKHDLSEPKP